MYGIFRARLQVIRKHETEKLEIFLSTLTDDLSSRFSGS